MKLTGHEEASFLVFPTCQDLEIPAPDVSWIGVSGMSSGDSPQFLLLSELGPWFYSLSAKLLRSFPAVPLAALPRFVCLLSEAPHWLV